MGALRWNTCFTSTNMKYSVRFLVSGMLGRRKGSSLKGTETLGSGVTAQRKLRWPQRQPQPLELPGHLPFSLPHHRSMGKRVHSTSKTDTESSPSVAPPLLLPWPQTTTPPLGYLPVAGLPAPAPSLPLPLPACPPPAAR